MIRKNRYHTDNVLEREYESWIIDCGNRFEWRSWHVPAPMRAIGKGKFVPEPRAAGLPDLFMLHEDPARFIIAEVKIHTALSPDQREFLRLCEGVVQEILAFYAPGSQEKVVGVYVFRPGMEEAIETMLRSKILL